MNNRLYYLSRGQMNAIYGIQSMRKTKISQFKSNKIISFFVIYAEYKVRLHSSS